MQISGLLDPTVFLALLPGGDVVVKQHMASPDAMPSAVGDVISASTGQIPGGAPAGCRSPRGPTHCPRLAQLLLRILAATYPWDWLAQQEPSPYPVDTHRILEYIRTLLDDEPLLSTVSSRGGARKEPTTATPTHILKFRRILLYSLIWPPGRWTAFCEHDINAVRGSTWECIMTLIHGTIGRKLPY